MNEERMRDFANLADFRAYLQDSEREAEVIREAQRRRPFRDGDQLFRATFVAEGMAFLYSIVHREDGSIEFWVKRYTDEDVGEWDEEREAFVTEITHSGFTLVTILHRKEENL